MDEVNRMLDEFCPYVGLQPYSEADKDYFFGRERDSRIITSNLYAASLTVLYGPSGVGKSSILRAGVVPRLQSLPRTTVVIFDGWADQSVLHTLKAKCLEAVAKKTGDRDVQLDLKLPLDELLLLATQASDTTILIILDQFEEYFLYHPMAEIHNLFDSEFARAVNREDVDASFLVAMREDTLSWLDRFRARIPNMLANMLRLRHLDAASAEDAMRKPLEVYAARYPAQPSMTIEDALVEELIKEIQVGKLTSREGGQGVAKGFAAEEDVRIEAPFLQLALTRLWNEERERGSQLMRLETLHALGSVDRIVRTHMDSQLNALEPDEQEIAADLFRYMVTPSGTKIAYTAADMEFYAKSTRPLQPVLDKLAQRNARIVRPVTSPGEPGIVRYEIYHDVLASAVLDWRARYEKNKQQLSLFMLLIEEGDLGRAFQVYQDIVQRTPHLAFFPERYEVRNILGRGDLGVSYLVFDREKDHLLAATMLEASNEFTQVQLDQFTSQMSKLSSPRISRILGFERHRDLIYMLSEYTEGADLRSHMAQNMSLTHQDAMSIARQILEALEDGTLQGLPHLSLRPSNIVLGAMGVKLVDYGTWRLISLNRNTDMPIKRYMADYLAPEQLSGQEGDQRSDVYAMGTVLYEMLTGRVPKPGEFRIVSEVHPQTGEALDVLIKHARAYDPGGRFQTVAELKRELHHMSLSTEYRHFGQYFRMALARLSSLYAALFGRRSGCLTVVIILALLLVGTWYTGSSEWVIYGSRALSLFAVTSLAISALGHYIVREIAKLRGLGSLIASGRGVGAILGLLLMGYIFRTTNWGTSGGLDGVPGFDFLGYLLISLSGVLIMSLMTLGVFHLAGLVFERQWNHYTLGFYAGFLGIFGILVLMTLLGTPSPILSW